MTTAEAVKAGIIPEPEPERGSHEHMVSLDNDYVLEAVINDLGKRNLSDYRDHETRWCADRLRAARAERRKRKAAGTYCPEVEPRPVAAS